MRVHSESFQVKIGSSNGAAHLRVTGRFDVVALPVFEQVFHQVQNEDVVLDLRGLTSIDAPAWLAVVAREARIRERGRRMRLVNVPRDVRRIFELTATEHLLARSSGG